MERNRRSKRSAFSSDEQRWRAVLGKDRKADGAFFFSVKSTGVYCRPSCPARPPRRANVQFHLTSAQAERAGFRACKRCRPDALSMQDEHAVAVAKACKLIAEARVPHSLDALASAVGMSPSHFHRIFKSLTGVTPKKFALANRSAKVRDALRQNRTITSAIYAAGFNSNGRFYSNSNKALGMKPANFKVGGEGAIIRFAIGQCTLGSILVAATELGICAIALGDDAGKLLRGLEDRFPKATLIGGDKPFEKLVAQVIAFVERPAAGLKLPLHVQGTAFQHRVWQKLCEIPGGQTRSYSAIAKSIREPAATRAIARACATNEIAVAIPCHRVVRTDGSFSGYRWGIDRKARLLQLEQPAR